MSDPRDALHLRRALPADAPVVAECVEAAYAHWVPRIGRKPWPMLQDYRLVIESEHVVLAEVRVCATLRARASKITRLTAGGIAFSAAG